MPKPNNKTAQRGFVAVAATALVVGGSFMPAAAAPEGTDAPSESPSASAPATATSTATATEGAVQTDGLSEAVKRDLGKTVEEFNAESKVSEEAAEIREKLNDEGIKASASVKDGKAEIKVSKSDETKTKKVMETAAAKTASITTDIGKINTVGDVYEEVLENVKPSELTRLTAIMNTKNGLQIIADGPAAAERKATPSKSAAVTSLTLEEFVAQAEGVKLVEGSGPAKTSAANDYFGAMGYLVDKSGQPSNATTVCSAGFNAWAPSGADAIITAGHCTEDGEGKIFGIAEQSKPNVLESIGAPLGTFGFGQFGGPNNSGAPADNDEPGTDIAVIDDINPDLNLPALVSNWPAAGPREGSVKVTGVSKAVVGANACSSGRTTGWSCSEIIGDGVFFVYGYKNDLRSVQGYMAKNPGQTVLDQGDSGGPVMVGSRAVGINSANSPGADGVENNSDDIAMYTSLADVQSKGYINGYQVKFFVNAPKVTSVSNGAEVEPGAKLSGTVTDASSGTKVNVIVDGKVVDTVTVDSSGNFSFTAPQTKGTYSFTLEAVNGLNKSEQVNGNVVVVAPEPTPTPTEPTEPTTPTEPTQPTEPTTPTEPTQPTEPTEPTQPTVEPSESATPTEPTDSTEEPSESASPSTSAEPTASASDEPSKSTEAKEPKKDEPKQDAPKKDEPKKDEPLAETGAGSVPLIAAGGALALIGAAVLLLRRSDRRHG